MTRRAFYAAALLVLLALNTYAGVAKVAGFLHGHRAEKAMARADLDSAFAGFESAAGWQPGDAPSRVLLGRVIQLALVNGLPVKGLEDQGIDHKLAFGLAATARAIALDPTDAWAWFSLAELYRGHRAARARITRLRAVGQAAPSGIEPGVVEGASSAAGPEPEDGLIVAAALKAVELEPMFPFYHDSLAELYRSRGLKADAAREIRRSFAVSPLLGGHPWIEDLDFLKDLADPILEGIDRAGSDSLADPIAVAQARADVLERLGRVPEAIAALADLRRLGGKAVEAECDLRVAKLHQRERRYQESLPFLERVLQAETERGQDAPALYHLALAHSRLGNHEEAVKHYRRYLTKRRGSLGLLLDLAGELEIVGKAEEAGQIYRALVERFPEEPVAYNRLIAHLRRRRQMTEALDYARRLVRIDPSNEAAARLLGQIQAEAALLRTP